MSGFGDEMQAQLEAFRNAGPIEAKKKTGKAATEYECEVSGIDMVVSRVVNGKCTMKMFLYLSQPNESGNGTILIKSIRDGIIKEGDENNITTFLKDMKNDKLETGSNAIPILRSGKKFAERLDTFRNVAYIDLIKEGLLNTEMFNDDEYELPWYVPGYTSYYTRGKGVSDKHAKLIRHAVTALAKKFGIEYWDALTRTCKKSRYWNNEGKSKFDSVWAFSMLADIYDEPYALKCFDEYLDNERLEGLYYTSIENLFNAVVPRDYDSTWKHTVERFRNGQARTNLDKNRLWEYIQESVGMGLGRNLSGFFNTYCDYLSQAYNCDKKVKDKYPEYLQVAHDIYSEKYKLIVEFRQSQNLREQAEKGSAISNLVHEGYQLKVLGTVNEFLEEAQQNCNCVASYVDKASKGSCWIASFRPVGDEKTLLTIEIDPSTGEMVQIKGKCNRDATNKERELLKHFQDSIYKKMKKKTE